MYSQQDPAGSVSLAQMLNSDLRQAQLDLLSAHCAAHQLRLRYSNEDLARFGRRDILRKSAEAASALNSFYSAIEKRVPAPVRERAHRFSAEQIAQGIAWFASCQRTGRERYLPLARPLGDRQMTLLSPYFSPSLLGSIRIAELNGDRVPEPEFYAQARALGLDNLPDVSHMESLIFLDVIVFNEKFSERALFHSLVHAVQLQVLGLDRYAERWIRGFLRTRAHFAVPLEVQAFSLASKFVRPTQPAFSVESEVLLWKAEDRY
jgi:hypothetical protein